MTRLVGKSRTQIAEATKHWTREELLDLIFRMASAPPHLTSQELAALRRISKYKVIDLIYQGKLRAHRPLANGEFRIEVESIHEWDERTRFFPPDNSATSAPIEKSILALTEHE
jgi:excisionase family DNA binding protein